MAQIEKRENGSYRIRVFCGYSADGKRQKSQSMTWKPTHDNMNEKQIERAVQKAAFEFEQQCRTGQTVNTQKFETFCEYWFENYAQRTLKQSGIDRCRGYMPRVVEKLGHYRIDKITPFEIDSFIAWLQNQRVQNEANAECKIDLKSLLKEKQLKQKDIAEKAGVSPQTVKAAIDCKLIKWENAQKLSAALEMPCDKMFKKLEIDKLLTPKTIKNYVSFVSTVFDYAIRLKAIAENPCKNAAIPKIPHRGEILGLEWNDIDFEHNIVHIRRTVHYSKELGYYDTEPKSKNSVRALTLPENVLYTLRQLQNEQLSQRLKLGDKWHNTSRLFTTWDGHQMHGATPFTWLTKICKQYDLPKVNLHSFRHLNASLLISQGVDVKTVQSVLGHSQASTTLDIYAAAFREREAQALGAVADVLNTPKSKAK